MKIAEKKIDRGEKNGTMERVAFDSAKSSNMAD